MEIMEINTVSWVLLQHILGLSIHLMILFILFYFTHFIMFFDCFVYTDKLCRRNSSAVCYNDRDTDHIDSQTPCRCSFADYEWYRYLPLFPTLVLLQTIYFSFHMCSTRGYTPSARNATNGFTCIPTPTASCGSVAYISPPHSLLNLSLYFFSFTYIRNRYQLVPSTMCDISSGLDLTAPQPCTDPNPVFTRVLFCPPPCLLSFMSSILWYLKH